jgi:hypothetical protein
MNEVPKLGEEPEVDMRGMIEGYRMFRYYLASTPPTPDCRVSIIS